MTENEHSQLKAEIEELWEIREKINDFSRADKKAARKKVRKTIGLLNDGIVRVAEISEAPDGTETRVKVNEWLRYGILLTFQLTEMEIIYGYPFEYRDKLPLKKNYEKLGVRVVPGASARYGSYLAPGVILMPSYINIGAYVGENTLVDTWATVGSCAQVGKNVHLSGGVGIGGVLEPPNAQPVIIGDDCLIGSRCVVAEGAIVGQGSVLGAGCVLTKSIPVYDRADLSQPVSRGEIPPWSVAVSAVRSSEQPGGSEQPDTAEQPGSKSPSIHTPCVLIVKRLEEGERHDKARLNEILRENDTSV